MARRVAIICLLYATMIRHAVMMAKPRVAEMILTHVWSRRVKSMRERWKMEPANNHMAIANKEPKKCRVFHPKDFQLTETERDLGMDTFLWHI